MNTRRVASAFLLAVFVSATLTLWLGKRLSAQRSSGVALATRPILVAAEEISAGVPITATQLHTIQWPASEKLPSAFTQPREVIGRVPLFPLAAGEPVLVHDLAASGAGAGLTSEVPDGFRAMTVRSDELSGVAGFLGPGSRVDVLVTYRLASDDAMATATVLQDVLVLAVGQRTEQTSSTKPSVADSVTLLVSPGDAQKLALAGGMGKIAFVLRNGGDQTTIASLPIQSSSTDPHVVDTNARILPRPAPARTRAAAAAPPQAASYAIETIAGSKHSEESFGGSE